MTSLCPCVPGVEPPLHPDDVFILFLDYDVIIFGEVNPLGYCDVIVPLCPCCRTALHHDDVFILCLDYDVIIFGDVNPLGYCDVIVSLCPCCRTPNFLLLLTVKTAENSFVI